MSSLTAGKHAGSGAASNQPSVAEPTFVNCGCLNGELFYSLKEAQIVVERVAGGIQHQAAGATLLVALGSSRTSGSQA